MLPLFHLFPSAPLEGDLPLIALLDDDVTSLILLYVVEDQFWDLYAQNDRPINANSFVPATFTLRKVCRYWQFLMQPELNRKIYSYIFLPHMDPKHLHLYYRYITECIDATKCVKDVWGNDIRRDLFVVMYYNTDLSWSKYLDNRYEMMAHAIFSEYPRFRVASISLNGLALEWRMAKIDPEGKFWAHEELLKITQFEGSIESATVQGSIEVRRHRNAEGVEELCEVTRWRNGKAIKLFEATLRNTFRNLHFNDLQTSITNAFYVSNVARGTKVYTITYDASKVEYFTASAGTNAPNLEELALIETGCHEIRYGNQNAPKHEQAPVATLGTGLACFTFPNLEKFEVRGVTTGWLFPDLLSNFPGAENLTSLVLRCDQLSDYDLIRILQVTRKLEHLRVCETGERERFYTYQHNTALSNELYARLTCIPTSHKACLAPTLREIEFAGSLSSPRLFVNMVQSRWFALPNTTVQAGPVARLRRVVFAIMPFQTNPALDQTPPWEELRRLEEQAAQGLVIEFWEDAGINDI